MSRVAALLTLLAAAVVAIATMASPAPVAGLTYYAAVQGLWPGP